MVKIISLETLKLDAIIGLYSIPKTGEDDIPDAFYIFTRISA